ncbi:MAG: alpha-galactosidase [Deltaproteobacteria bacterium]|nr:alpha-galactosidase [Deltaproteobacteria bacterium]
MRALCAISACLVLVCQLIACEGGQDCGQRMVLGAEGVRIEVGCGGASASLCPAARVAGSWLGGQGGCEQSDGILWCPAGSAGRVGVSEEEGALELRFEAFEDVELEGIELRGELDLPGAVAWLSNGFQSWSQTGLVAIGEPVEEARLDAQLLARGDAEVLREGDALSWFYTFAGGGEMAMLAGALRAERFKPWLQVARSGLGLNLRLVSGCAGEQVSLRTGQQSAAGRWLVLLGPDLAQLGERYGRALAGRQVQRSVPASPELGWNSWYELFDGVDESSVLENAALARGLLEPLSDSGSGLRIVVDDGWQLAWGDWQPNEEFPDGLSGLAAELKADGFEVGIWLAPLLVDADLPLVVEHPDWFVEGAVYDHAKHGRMRVLDPTQPQARAFLQETIARLVSWGYDLLKIDFLFAGAFEGGRHEPVTGLEAYHLALQAIREAAGEQVVLLAVGAPPVVSFPYAELWRVGPDIALEPFGPSWHFAVSQARSLSGRWPLCLAAVCDPDPPLLRQMEAEEVGFGTWVVALAGGGFFLSDDLRRLPEERRSWGLDADRLGLAQSGEPARPLDVFGRPAPLSLATALEDHLTQANSHVLPVRYRLSDGGELYLNLSDEAVEVDGVTVPARGARRLSP